jgi:hypothetical protein
MPELSKAEMARSNDASYASTGKMEGPVPEQKNTPPEATKGSGPESGPSVPGPRKRTFVPIPGAKVIRCISCDRFIGEVKGTIEKGRFYCRHCGQVNLISMA